MSRTILFIAAFWLAVPLWGQSGIMPRRSSSIKIPSQETMEKIIEAAVSSPDASHEVCVRL